MAVVCHEVAHGHMAGFLGDPTARLSGRLTLNPLKHLDPVGSVFVPFLLFLFGLPIIGWAKPVPYNPYLLKGGKWGPALVALAGPMANIFLAIVFGLFIRLGGQNISMVWINFAALIVLINIFLAIFNLIPVPPLDGSKILVAVIPFRFRFVLDLLERYQLIFLLLVVYIGGQLISPLAGLLFWLLTGMGL